MMYRNKTILQLASEAPHCMFCLSTNGGDVVAAHSNQLRDGKGTGHKSHDYRVAYLCAECHREVDSGQMSRQDKSHMWEHAHRETIGWLFENGHLEVRK